VQFGCSFTRNVDPIALPVADSRTIVTLTVAGSAEVKFVFE